MLGASRRMAARWEKGNPEPDEYDLHVAQLRDISARAMEASLPLDAEPAPGHGAEPRG